MRLLEGSKHSVTWKLQALLQSIKLVHQSNLVVKQFIYKPISAPLGVQWAPLPPSGLGQATVRTGEGVSA